MGNKKLALSNREFEGDLQKISSGQGCILERENMKRR